MSAELTSELAAGVLTVTIRRPRRMNAFGHAVCLELTETITAAAANPDVRVVVITGEGTAFCTGADLAGEKIEPEESLDSVNAYIRAIVAADVPVIAKVNGACAGMAVGLALACDLVYMADDAYFLLPFVGIGLLPDAGTTALVPAGVGRSRAMSMALLGDRVYGPEALAGGMVTAVVPRAELDGAVAAAAARLVTGARRAILATKAAINAATLAELDGALAREKRHQVQLLRAPDFKEGVDAMLGKRAPVFTD